MNLNMFDLLSLCVVRFIYIYNMNIQDVREVGELDHGVIDGSINIPQDELSTTFHLLPGEYYSKYGERKPGADTEVSYSMYMYLYIIYIYIYIICVCVVRRARFHPPPKLFNVLWPYVQCIRI